MKKRILFIFLSISLNLHAGIIPVLTHYDGVGSIYGIGYEYKDERNKLLVGGAAGGANVFGALYTRYLSSDLELSLGGGVLSSGALETTYLRGLRDDSNNRYILGFNASGFALGTKYWLLNDFVSLTGSISKTTIQFDKYYNIDGEQIELPEANLFDIETLGAKFEVGINFYDRPRLPTSGLGIDLGINNQSGRKGQSDQTIISYGATGLIPLNDIFRIKAKVKMSSAAVNKNKKYDTEAEVRDAFGVDCSSITNSNKRAECEQLEAALVDYVVASNNQGVADPLGGSSSLRSFREFRFKAAHTAFYGVEFKSNISRLFNLGSQSSDSFIDFVLFYDIGHANDDRSELFEDSKFSNGFGLSLVKGSGAVKFQYAHGSDESNSYSLTVGAGF